MLKPQDVVLLLKLLANAEHLNWPQHQLATHLCLSISAINASLARLKKSNLLQIGMGDERYPLVVPACLELILSGVKYFFPVECGEPVLGIKTGYAAPVFQGRITFVPENLPVWPSAEGKQWGMRFEPLYHCVTDSLVCYPDQAFYDLLALVDAVRGGRARERNIAAELIKERLLVKERLKHDELAKRNTP